MTQPTDNEIYGRSALANGEPWIVPVALIQLKALVQPTWRVFEWGSGGSTVYWSRHCRYVVSIEHDVQWQQRTIGLLQAAQCPANWLIHCVPGTLNAQGQPDHRSSYRTYANAILKLPDRSFDLIYVDGEASSRGWCLHNALPKLVPGGYLLLDNSDWLKDYDFGPEWERQDYVAKGLHWVGQSGTFDWWTSILHRRGT